MSDDPHLSQLWSKFWAELNGLQQDLLKIGTGLAEVNESLAALVTPNATQPSAPVKQRTCSNCGKPGHRATTCKEKGVTNGQTPLPPDTPSTPSHTPLGA